MKVLSVAKVLKVAGSPTRLQRLLWRAGQPYPTLRAIYGWKVKGLIAARWQAPILWALACKNHNPVKFLQDKDTDKPAHIRVLRRRSRQ